MWEFVITEFMRFQIWRHKCIHHLWAQYSSRAIIHSRWIFFDRLSKWDWKTNDSCDVKIGSKNSKPEIFLCLCYTIRRLGKSFYKNEKWRDTTTSKYETICYHSLSSYRIVSHRIMWDMRYKFILGVTDPNLSTCHNQSRQLSSHTHARTHILRDR